MITGASWDSKLLSYLLLYYLNLFLVQPPTLFSYSLFKFYPIRSTVQAAVTFALCDRRRRKTFVGEFANNIFALRAH